jgi:aldehyde dehydrogenase (NAD+)
MAVSAPAEAFKSWRRTAPVERARLMNRHADLVLDHVEELGGLETLAIGAHGFYRGAQRQRACNFSVYYTGWAYKICEGAFPNSGDSTYRIVTHEPLRVCAGIAA